MWTAQILPWCLLLVNVRSLKLQDFQALDPLASVSLHADAIQSDGDSEEIPDFLREVVSAMVESKKLEAERKDAMLKMLVKALTGGGKKTEDASDADGDDSEEDGTEDNMLQTLIKNIGADQRRQRAEDCEQTMHMKVPSALDVKAWVIYGALTKDCKKVLKEEAKEKKMALEQLEGMEEERQQKLNDNEVPPPSISMSVQNSTRFSNKTSRRHSGTKIIHVPSMPTDGLNETPKVVRFATNVTPIETPPTPITTPNGTPQVTHFTNSTKGQISTIAHHNHNTSHSRNGTDIKNSSGQSAE